MIVHELTLRTARPVSLRNFYEGLLGFKCNFDGKRVRVEAGHTRLQFDVTDDGSLPYYHFAFNIPGGQIEDAVAQLDNKIDLLSYGGQKIVEFPSWDARSVYFTDPAGNVVEYISRQGLAHPSVRPFDTGKVIGLSEVGWPVEDLGGERERLMREYGLKEKVFDREKFCALGDDHGLFILVHPERKTWFPTKFRSLPFPAEVVFSVGEKRFRERLKV